MVFCALVVGKGFSVLFSWPDRLCLQPLQSFLGPHLYPLLIFLSCYLPIIIFLTASSLSPGSPPHPYPNFIFFNLVGKFISIFPRYPQSLFQTHHFLHSSILPSNIFFLKSNFDTRACTKAWQSLSYLFFHAKVLSSLLSPSYLFIISQAQVSFLFILSSFERCIHHHSLSTFPLFYLFIFSRSSQLSFLPLRVASHHWQGKPASTLLLSFYLFSLSSLPLRGAPPTTHITVNFFRPQSCFCHFLSGLIFSFLLSMCFYLS